MMLAATVQSPSVQFPSVQFWDQIFVILKHWLVMHSPALAATGGFSAGNRHPYHRHISNPLRRHHRR